MVTDELPLDFYADGKTYLATRHSRQIRKAFGGPARFRDLILGGTDGAIFRLRLVVLLFLRGHRRFTRMHHIL